MCYLRSVPSSWKEFQLADKSETSCCSGLSFQTGSNEFVYILDSEFKFRTTSIKIPIEVQSKRILIDLIILVLNTIGLVVIEGSSKIWTELHTKSLNSLHQRK